MRFFYSFSLLLLAFFSAKAQSLSPQIVGTGFQSPVDIKSCGDNRLFIVEQRGRIKIMSKTGAVNPTLFLDIVSRVNSNGNEQGLLGLAFSPNYKQDGYFFVNYINGAGAGKTRISRFQVSATDSNVADVNSELVLLEVTQPFSNHNGGNMMFGPDGYLYISLGDGGSAGDPGNRSQNLGNALGKMHRIDPFSGDSLYGIPADNPFLSNPSAIRSIWATGLRNAWRCSFDRFTGDMWLADVGQDVYEEFNFQPAGFAGGANYGWRCYEANQPYNTTGCQPASAYVPPVFAYGHSGTLGCSVTGGYVYRGVQFQSLWGKYIATDFCGSRFFVLTPTQNGWDPDTLTGGIANQFSTFGEDNFGELYLAGRVNGNVYRLRDNANCTPLALFETVEDTLFICPGDQVDLQAMPGDSLTYNWQLNGSAVPSTGSAIYEASSGGYYSFQVSKPGCSNTDQSDSILVIVRDVDNVSIVNMPDSLCNSQGITLEANLPGGTFTVNGQPATTIPALSAPGTYTVTYSLVDNNGCTSTNTTLTEVVVCTGVEEMSASTRWTLYPNPAKSTVTIQASDFDADVVSVQVIDMTGRIVQEQDFIYRGEYTIDVSDWLPGIYTVHLAAKTGNQVMRLIIN